MPAAGALATSKSFRAILPGSAEGARLGAVAADDVAELRRYCEDNFAASAVFVD